MLKDGSGLFSHFEAILIVRCGGDILNDLPDLCIDILRCRLVVFAGLLVLAVSPRTP